MAEMIPGGIFLDGFGRPVDANGREVPPEKYEEYKASLAPQGEPADDPEVMQARVGLTPSGEWMDGYRTGLAEGLAEGLLRAGVPSPDAHLLSPAPSPTPRLSLLGSQEPSADTSPAPPPASDDLPEDFPGRAALADNNLTTVSAVAALSDKELLDLPHVGERTVPKIAADPRIVAARKALADGAAQ